MTAEGAFGDRPLTRTDERDRTHHPEFKGVQFAARGFVVNERSIASSSFRYRSSARSMFADEDPTLRS